MLTPDQLLQRDAVLKKTVIKLLTAFVGGKKQGLGLVMWSRFVENAQKKNKMLKGEIYKSLGIIENLKVGETLKQVRQGLCTS